MLFCFKGFFLQALDDTRAMSLAVRMVGLNARWFAEVAVKIVHDMEKSSKYYLGLLSYRNTKLENEYSSDELLYHRKLRDNLPRI